MAAPQGAPGWRELRQHRIANERKETLARRKSRRPQARGHERDEGEGESSKKRGGSSTKPRIGFVRGTTIERLFILSIYAGVFLLIVLSVIGTFYGAQSSSAPITDPGAIWAAMRDSGYGIWAAVAGQAALSLAQYGARQLARHDARWWLLYLAALGISVYFNVQAYAAPLQAWMLPGYAYGLILAFDILPEFVSIRHD